MLRSEIAQLRALGRRQGTPEHCKRRAAPLVAVGLVVLVPVSIFAANPVFSDLGDAAEIYQGNILAIDVTIVVTIFRLEDQSLFGSCIAFRGQNTAIFVPFLDDTPTRRANHAAASPPLAHDPVARLPHHRNHGLL